MKPEIMWAIIGVYGLYCGTWLRRKDAIDQHCREKGATWRDCRKRGDRAVRVVISLAPKFSRDAKRHRLQRVVRCRPHKERYERRSVS
jgi:hypothetical protein